MRDGIGGRTDCHQRFASESGVRGEHTADVRLPPYVWLDARHHDDVAGSFGEAQGQDVVRRPHDDALAIVVETGLGSDLREVVERIGVDESDLFGVSSLDEMFESHGRGARHVEPSGEGDHENRPAQRCGHTVPRENVGHFHDGESVSPSGVRPPRRRIG